MTRRAFVRIRAAAGRARARRRRPRAATRPTRRRRWRVARRRPAARGPWRTATSSAHAWAGPVVAARRCVRRTAGFERERATLAQSLAFVSALSSPSARRQKSAVPSSSKHITSASSEHRANVAASAIATQRNAVDPPVLLVRMSFLLSRNTKISSSTCARTSTEQTSDSARPSFVQRGAVRIADARKSMRSSTFR